MAENPIRYSDLIVPDESIEKLIAQLEQLEQIYTSLLQKVQAEAKNAQKAQQGMTGATEQGRKSIREAATDAEKLARAERDLAFAQSETAKEIAKLKEQTREQNNLNKAAAKEAMNAKGSYNALSAEYTRLKIELNKLTAEERKNTEAGRQMEKQAEAVYQEMKRLQDATGKFQLNVGNYSSALNGLGGVLGSFKSGLGGVTSVVSKATLGITSWAAAGIAAVGVVKDNIATVREYEKAVSGLAAILGTTKDQMTALTDQAQNLGATTIFTASEVAQLQTELAKLGYSVNDIIKPAPGVKVSKITGLADDIALNMAATAVRIEQIPGKAAIGIEVPNRELESVQLREVLENPAFAAAKSKLTVGLGKDIGGQAIFADLAKMPHLLVAGATGSGKSVCINTLITSVLFKAKPTEVKFILIDPKMVELSVYNDIPHLMVPVVTDAKKAASVLNWAVQEMEKRYGLIAQVGVRNMEGYNKLFADEPEQQLPSIVIIIDELADLMMVAPHDVEDAICRIAQKARAAGIYLVLATQRPSVNVITGVIKANIPSRISFAVTSQIDSRTILDASGAEKLLGKGDMLFKPQEANKPTRIQGAFVSDKEVEMLTEYIKSQGHKLEANQEIIDFTNKAVESENDGENDEKASSGKVKIDSLLRDAVELTMSSGSASASSFQRRYHIGYSRAGRLLDTMEQLGIVGPPQGSKPREILVTEAQAFEIMDNYENQ